MLIEMQEDERALDKAIASGDTNLGIRPHELSNRQYILSSYKPSKSFPWETFSVSSTLVPWLALSWKHFVTSKISSFSKTFITKMIAGLPWGCWQSERRILLK
ncbi:hypothetical protein DSO57_1037825 [Entomophthora muscae]|uniref:Uncharacterized protein n=1 Tax=Entomophthora muscae TaxID=34485 RepID=A0ACC2U8H5_9FUNG|nr:hypothetical protein DSO57_1037825 [Entomophthora muscae]